MESFLLRNPSSLPINDVVLSVRDSEGKFDVILYDDVPSDLRDFSKHLAVRKMSVVFQNLCSECGRRLFGQQWLLQGIRRRETAVVREVVNGLCQPVAANWNRICRLTLDASITLADIKQTFGVVMEDSHSDAMLRKELLVIQEDSHQKGTEDWIEKRIQQFHCFLDLERAVGVGQVLLSVRTVLKLAGDFGNVVQMCESVSHLCLSDYSIADGCVSLVCRRGFPT